MLGIVGESGSEVGHRQDVDEPPPRTAKVEGEVIFEGKDVRKLAAEGQEHFWGVQMTMVFQDPMTSLNPVKKCGEQIAETLRYHLGRSRKERDRRGRGAFGQVGIPEPGKRVHQYPTSSRAASASRW
ncbi:MAG: hypothetical protein R2695_22020 [Acidimicrobiales bacterium]